MSLSQALNQFAQNLGRYRIVGAGTSCFVQNIKMLVRSIAQHAHYLREISCYPSTMRPDKAHCASGTTTVTR